MDRTDYPFDFDEWLQASKAKMHEASDFIGDHHYRHFDSFVTFNDFDTNSSLLIPKLKEPERLAKHSFYPFIRRDKKVRRFTRDKTNGGLKIGQKIRPIMYASHADACIYAFYSFMLKKRYEVKIAGSGLNESVVAYRHIPRDDGTGKGKSNIEFAKEVKDLSGRYEKCAVLCLDISKFFDTMDHALIKERWNAVLDTTTLPIGHYTIFKNVTKFRYVFLHEALVKLGYGHLKKGKFVFAKGAKHNGILCTPAEFRTKIDAKTKSIVHKNTSQKGIPQGSPISDIIANMYLEGFDRKILDKLSSFVFGYYRRYSDDILIICPEDKVKDMYDFAVQSIKDDKLLIKPSKSEAVVINNKTKLVKDITFQLTGDPEHSNSAREVFQYLGFEIDAVDMHLRSGTIAAHYRRALRRARAENAEKANKSTTTRGPGKKRKSNRSRWQYFISSERRTGSLRIKHQYKKALKRVKSFSKDSAGD
ncbi:MAG TPA: reverse transcriptase domain-containing protein [Candidatus Saccharimonadales bacterium]|nr:reverse transcriptase domain-containing protein [Candidatus Saccharimonadales bacterium]